MRRIVGESLLAALLALVVVPITLGTIEQPCVQIAQSLTGSERPCVPPGWAERSVGLMKAAVQLDFTNAVGRMRIDSVPAETARRALVSAKLVGLALLVVLTMAIPLGIQAARIPDSRLWRGVRRLLDSASSLPLLLWSTSTYVALARLLGTPPNAESHATLATVCAVFSLTFGDRLLADVTQSVELAARDTLREPYMRTVRAGGFGVRRHLLQALVAPVATAMLSRAMYLVGGAIVVEFVFSFRGLGDLVVQGLNDDVNVALAGALMLMTFGVVIRLLHRGVLRLADARPAR